MITTVTILDACNKQKAEIAASAGSDVPRTSAKDIPEALPQFARIITGIRRCGKSTLVQQDILTKSPDSFYLNFDEPALSEFTRKDFAVLDEAINKYKLEHKKCNRLYFDEIQVVDGWEVYVNAKLKEGSLVTVTGSNASMLSQELGTRLTGRHLDYELFPFDFLEFCAFEKLKQTTASFEQYLNKGGFPEFLLYKREDILLRLFDDVLLRDVVVRHGIKDVRSLRVLAVYLISNVANLVAGARLSAQLGIKTTATILDYLSFLEQSYLFSFIPKFDYSLKVQSVNPKKVYCVDTGLVNTVTRSQAKDKGRVFENAVFMKLRRTTKNIWYYSEPTFECDFLYGKSPVPTNAVQACYELTNENREREVKGIVETCKKFPEIKPLIVTLKQTDTISYDGMMIRVVPAVEFFGEELF